MLVVVAAALVNREGQVLLQQRPEGKAMAGLWEFPGGKVEAGETPEAALCRELAEELGVNVSSDALLPLAFASTQAGGRPLLLLLYGCTRWQGEAQALEAPEIRWLSVADMPCLPMPPADVPLVDALGRWLSACPA